MSRTTGRRAGALAVLVVVGLATFGGVVAAPAGADAPNACKVLKRAEIRFVFGGTVGSGRKGLSTPGSVQCEYSASAAGGRPEGTVIVKLQTTAAKAAYDDLKQSSNYAPIDGVANALWNAKTHVVEILHGKVLVGLQGGFLVRDPLPLHLADDQAPLTGLAQIAAARSE